MLLRNRVEQCSKNKGVTLTEDAYEMFDYAFSKLGTPDENLSVALQRVSNGLNPEEANIARVSYIIDDIIQMANHAALDAKFDFVDGYLIWLVIINDGSYSSFLRSDYLLLPSTSHVYRTDKIRSDQIEYPAYSGMINGYSQLAPIMKEPGKMSRNQVKRFLYKHFQESNITHLNLHNVYSELVRLSSN